MVDKDLLKTPLSLEDIEQQGSRPAVVVLEPDDFEPSRSILRFGTGRPQKVFATVRSITRAERFAKGTVCIMGRSEREHMRSYRDDLGRRRAEAVKAALCGDMQRAHDIMMRIWQAETLDRHKDRWLAGEAGHVLEAIEPGGAGSLDERVRRFQDECGLTPDGLPARETWPELIEAYANAVSTKGWIIPNRIYTATGAASPDPGGVEIWVWPMTPPPPGGMTAWRTKDPVFIHPVIEERGEDASGGGAAAADAGDAASGPAESA